MSYQSNHIFGSETMRTRSSSTDSHEKYDQPKHLTWTPQVESGESHEQITEFPNKWAKFREPAAEFLGTMILIIFGTGVNCQVTLSNYTISSRPPSSKGEYLSISFGWAIGAALGVWVSGGISGGHINPAVTLAQAVFRGFSWKKVPLYITAQILGAFAGASLVYANYYGAIDIFEDGKGVRTVTRSASMFATFAADDLSNFQCFFSEALGTAVLLIVLAAITDKHNGPPPSGLVPLAVFITILGEGACLGMQTGYAINPARDLGPRLMCWIAGYGRELWTYRDQYWLHTPIAGPIVGAIVGTAIYDAFIFTGPESIFNRQDAATRRRRLDASTKPKVGISSDDQIV
ncbi:aquaporin, Major intrinsic protein family [Rhizoctonia solani]|uniref:Aquaporin, Major intrinsic protein family n=1 Tax=Rhizoctonia solani TaxID=456999 RepID=A0A8H8NZ31_9AGAM|nr:aquaporin, Major intrinsic protein family [Rhizoctonia solani]QRW22594.1 aquaporin, Major intrinsic protein family [Rhizoctonia solani]